MPLLDDYGRLRGQGMGGIEGVRHVRVSRSNGPHHTQSCPAFGIPFASAGIRAQQKISVVVIYWPSHSLIMGIPVSHSWGAPKPCAVGLRRRPPRWQTQERATWPLAVRSLVCRDHTYDPAPTRAEQPQLRPNRASVSLACRERKGGGMQESRVDVFRMDARFGAGVRGGTSMSDSGSHRFHVMQVL
jgi:hypothetical protein